MRIPALAIGAVVALSLAGVAPVRADPAAALQLVGANTLGKRGMNAALAIADHCAYVGSRNDAAAQVVDIGDPANPRAVGVLTRHPGSTPRELRTVPELRELLVLFYRLNGGLNGFDLYRWTTDCASPALVGHYDMGAAAPHEFYLWQDRANPARVLLFVSMFASAAEELQVLDISNPASPVHLGGWAVPSAYGHAPLHSIDVSGDGRTAYVSLWTGGLVVADSSDFAAGRANPVLRPLTLPGSVFRTLPGNVHSAVPLPGQARLLTTDERYPPISGSGCPFGMAHVVDISNPARPVVVSTISVPENQPAICAAAIRGTWTSHNPTLTAHLALLSWYSAGLEVFALDDATRPVRLAEYRASGTNPIQRDLQLGITDTMTWSYPVIVRGLIYVVDINQGLLVLRYTGPHQDEISTLDFSEGNSDVTRSAAAVSASPSASPGGSSPGASPAGRIPVVPASPRAADFPIAAAAAGSLLAAVIVILVARWRYRRGRPGL